MTFDTIYAQYPDWGWLRWKAERKDILTPRAYRADVMIAVLYGTGRIKVLKNRFGGTGGTLSVLPPECKTARNVPNNWGGNSDPAMTPLERAGHIVREVLDGKT